jgi:hypothetical protein
LSWASPALSIRSAWLGSLQAHTPKACGSCHCGPLRLLASGSC